MTHAEVLSGAADLLERDGWTQRNVMDEQGRRCVVGALASVLDIASKPCTPQGYWDALNALRDHLGVDDGVTIWNDEPGRTQGEVIQALREAAA